MPKGIPLTQEEQANRRREIFDAAAGLILAKGFPATSMREIAAAAGMGKSTLYDYFLSKDDILTFMVEEATHTLTQRAQAIACLDLPPAERLRRIMAAHLDYMQANENLFGRLGADVQHLGPANQRRIQQGRYAYQDLVAAVIREGIAQGCFRPVDPLHAARLLVNSLLSVLYTSRPTGSPKEMLDQTLSIFLEGIST
jgi:AcrR family transcriptional regulator